MGVTEDSLEIRAYVLHQSLIFENVIGIGLAKLLDIEEPSVSYSFGNSSKAISFNQKIFLLIDIGALHNSDKTKFIKFMEIRNQFIHNANANTLKQCLTFIDGGEKYLLKTYPQNHDDEFHLRLALNTLIKDVCTSANEIIEKLIVKNKLHFNTEKIKILYEYSKASNKIILNGLKELFKVLNSISATGNAEFDNFKECLPELEEFLIGSLNKIIKGDINELMKEF